MAITLAHLSAALLRSAELRSAAEREELAKLAAKRATQGEREAAWQAELTARRQQEDPAWLAEKQEAEDAAWLVEFEKLAKEIC